MADVVRGDGVIFYAKLGTTYYPFACSKDVTITHTTDKIELAPYTSGKWRSYIYGRTTGTITSSGVVKVLPDSGKNGIFDLLDSLKEHFIILTKYSVTDPQGNSKTYEVPCLIDEVTISGTVGATATYTFSLTVNGDPSFDQVVVDTPLTDVDSWSYTATGGETVISDSSILGVDVLDVRRNGIGLEVIYSGTPTGNQVYYNSSAGSLTFGFALGVDEWILTIYVD
jgi:hypothetical protein